MISLSLVNVLKEIVYLCKRITRLVVDKVKPMAWLIYLIWSFLSFLSWIAKLQQGNKCNKYHSTTLLSPEKKW